MAAISLDLERAYARAGSDVRDSVFRLHEFVRAPEPDPARAAFGEFATFAPWLAERLAEDAAGGRWRGATFRWIEVASERLTMRAYHRADQFDRHARVLVADPCALAGVHVPLDAARAVLRFADLQRADEHFAAGRDRLRPPEANDGFGGTYAYVDEAIPRGPSGVVESASRLAGDLEGVLAPIAGADIAREMAAATRARAESGAWPKNAAPPAPERRISEGGAQLRWRFGRGRA